MIRCPNCQEENPDEAYYCYHCGKTVQETPPEKKAAKGGAGWMIVTILSVLIALGAAGGAYYFYRQTADKLSRAEQNTVSTVSKEQPADEEEISPEDAAAERYESYILTGKQAVFFEWQKRLENSVKENSGYAEIVNTRVVKIKENENAYFKDVDCVVEFIIRTDEAGSAPYYFTSNMYDNAVFYRDGTCCAASGFFRIYAQKGNADYTDYIEEIVDFGDRYRESLAPSSSAESEETAQPTDESSTESASDAESATP